MRLAFKDREGGQIYELPKKGHKRDDLFAHEPVSDYVLRFFGEVRGLANVHIYRIKGNKVKKIATRGY